MMRRMRFTVLGKPPNEAIVGRFEGYLYRDYSRNRRSGTGVRGLVRIQQTPQLRWRNSILLVAIVALDVERFVGCDQVFQVRAR